MTEEELKKYKKQIEALKKDFHKDNLENIESEKISDKDIMNNKIGSENKTSNNIVNKTSEKIDNSKNKFLEALKDTDNGTREDLKNVQKIKFLNTDNVSASENEKNQDKEDNTENSIDDVPPTINNNEENESKFPFLKYLLFFLLVVLIVFLAYYFVTEYNKKNKEKAKLEMIEKAYTDSVNTFNNKLKVQSEIEEKYNENNFNNSISDTIFNIVSRNPEGYYAIIGSYSELKNASKLKTTQKTDFTSYIFEQSPIRIGLKLSDDESIVYDDLKTVKRQFPDAWILYNKN